MLELFEERLPAIAAELAAGRTGLSEGVSLYHMLLEGVVFDAGQHALLDELADGALPGVREGVERVERDERWHVGFGLRCLIETRPSAEVLGDLLERAEEAAAAWGGAVPEATCALSARKVAHRLHVAGLITPRADGVTHKASTAPSGCIRSAVAATRARTRASSSGAVRPPAPQTAERTPAMSAAGGADHGQVLRPQGAGQRHLQARGVGVGHQRRERVGREPIQQPAAVLDRRVEQADPDAGGARHARQQLRRERRVRHAPGVRVGAGHHHRALHVGDGFADRPQQGDRVCPRSTHRAGRP